MFKLFLLLQGILTQAVGEILPVEMPQMIRTWVGGCVVIPCQYTLPYDEMIKKKVIMWYQHETETYIFRSNHTNKRATLAGDLQVGNCSLYIRNIEKGDSMNYRVRLEVQGVNYASSSAVDLRVSDEPTAPDLQVSSAKIVEGEVVTVTCSINHTCNMRPPSLTWNREVGEVQSDVVDLNNGIWQFLSSQKLKASSQHNGITFNCHQSMNPTVRLTSKDYKINVLYPPKNISVIIRGGEVREGQNISLYCRSGRSNPPVFLYSWHWVTDEGLITPLMENRSTILISNIKPSMRSFYCTAQNKVGSLTSPVLNVDVVYKPQITRESHCQPKLTVMECKCIILANPGASVMWRIHNSNITETGEGYHVSSSSSDHVTESRIKGPASLMTSVTCYATNKEGTTEVLLPSYWDIKKWLLIVGVTGGVLILLVPVIVKLLLSRRKNTDEQNTTKGCDMILHDQYSFEPQVQHGKDSAKSDEDVRYSSEPKDLIYTWPSTEFEVFEEDLIYANMDSVYANT